MKYVKGKIASVNKNDKNTSITINADNKKLNLIKEELKEGDEVEVFVDEKTSKIIIQENDKIIFPMNIWSVYFILFIKSLYSFFLNLILIFILAVIYNVIDTGVVIDYHSFWYALLFFLVIIPSMLIDMPIELGIFLLTLFAIPFLLSVKKLIKCRKKGNVIVENVGNISLIEKITMVWVYLKILPYFK